MRKYSELTFESLTNEIFPVRAISIMPNFDKTCSIAHIFPGSPVTSIMIELSDKSTTFARKICTISSISDLLAALVVNLD